MATITIAQALYIGNERGLSPLQHGGPERPDIKETASQTYVSGAPIYKDSNGTIAVAVASSNIITELCGFAYRAATGTTGAEVRYRAIRPGDRFIMNLKGTSTTVTALSMVGNKYMLDLHTGNLVVVNVDASFDEDKPYVVVEGLYTGTNYPGSADAVGDTYGRLVVQFPDQEGIQGG